MKLKHLLRTALAAITLMLWSFGGWGQVSINALSTNYTEDFNSLTNGTWTNGSTVNGWYARTDATSSITAYSANTGSTTTAGLYAFGVAGTNPVTDRALGYAPSNTYFGSAGTAKGYLGWRLKNNTGSTISSITVTWTGEQWRKENQAAAHTLSLYYQTGETVTDLITGSWTAAPSSFTSPIVGATTPAVLDGNASANRAADISVTINVSIPDGNEIMLRWEDLNDSGNDHYMAIDDITVSAERDTQAPSFTEFYPSVTNNDFTEFDINVNLNEPGTAYFVVLPNEAAEPSSAQVKAGKNAANEDLAANLKGTINVAAASTEYSEAITDLTHSTAYDVWVVAEDDEGTPNLQASATKVDALTLTPKAEPTNHLTGLTATPNSISQITLTWTDATGGTEPDGYLILIKTADTFTDPTDTNPVADDTNLSDGAGAMNIAQGVGTYAWTGLDASTQYFFKVYPYTNSSTYINYKTDPTVPTANATTLTPPSTYAVTFSVVGANGTLTAKVDEVSITSGDLINAGKDVVFTASPSAGYRVKEWKLNDAVIVGNTTNSYTLENLQETSNVTVAFEEITYTVTFTVTDGTNPIVGAIVTANSVALPATNASGQTTVDIANGTYSFSVTAVGFSNYSDDFTVSNANLEVPVSMIAVPLLVENFDYLSESTLLNNGWTEQGGPSTTNVLTIGEGNLEYLEYSSSNIGNILPVANTGQDAFKEFSAINSGSVYAAMLVNFSAATTGGDYFLNFKDGGGASNSFFYGRFYVKRDASNKLAFGVNRGSSTTGLTYSGFEYDLNTTYLVVIKYTMVTGATNDIAQLFVNPTLGAVEPAATVTNGDLSSVDASAIGGIMIRQGSATTAATLTIDGIRIARTWDEAVKYVPDTEAPVPTFSPLNNAEDVPLTVNPTITFNEVIYTSAGVLVDNTNVEDLITFEDNLSNPVPFTATIANKVITIVPNDLLIYSKIYNIEIAAVEDFKDNLMTSPASIQFTTVDPPKYTINFSVTGANGTLTAKVDGGDIVTGAEVLEGKNVDFTATPDAGYKVLEWTLNGTTVEGHTSNTYTITNILATATVTVEFTPILVSSITVTSEGDATEVPYNGTLQMYASVLPAEALDKTYTWSVENGTGSADISAGGLLDPTGAGTVTVKATANDGSGIVGTKEITITKVTPTVTTWPVANNSITYGQALSNAGLNTAGAVTSVPGTFAYTNPTLTPSVSTTGYSVTFTPTDAANYNTVVTPEVDYVSVTVVKASLTVTAKAGNITFGDVEPAVTVEYSGFVLEETEAVLDDTGFTLGTDYTQGNNVGTYNTTITAGTANDGNYAFVLTPSTFSVAKKNLQVTAVAPDITFGDAAPAVTVEYDGFYGDDDAADLDNTDFALGTNYTQGNNVGQYSTTIAIGDATDNNYNFTPLNTSTFDVLKANPNVVAWPTAGNITYGQAISASVFSGSDIRGVDDMALAGTLTFDTPTVKPVAGTDDYSVTFTPTSTNYNSITTAEIDYVDVTVLKYTATIDITNTTQTYSGDQKAVTVTVTPENDVVTSDPLTWVYTVTYTGKDGTVYGPSTTPPTEAGLYDVVVLINMDNYQGTLSDVLEVNVKVTPVVTWPTANNAIIYGQTLADAGLTGGSAAYPADHPTNPNDPIPGTFTYDNPTYAPLAGSYQADVTFTPTNTTEFNIVEDGKVTVTINTKELTIGGTFTVNTKPYDATVNATINTNELSLSGVVAGDEGNVTLNNVVVKFADANVGENIIVSVFSAGLTGSAVSNYTVTVAGAPSATADITERELSITGDFIANDKPYDGTVSATFNVNNLVLSNVANDEDVDLANVVIEFADIYVGNNIEVSIASAELTGTATLSNYSLTLTDSPLASADITPKELTIKGDFTANSKPYDGLTSATFSANNLELDGVVGVEDVDLSNIVIEFADADAAINKVVSIASADLTGADKDNYSLSLVGAPTALADINKKELTIGGDFTANNKYYDGTTVATINENTLTLIGKVEGDIVSLTNIVVAFASAEVADGIQVSITAADLTGDDEPNYTLSLVGAPTATANILEPLSTEANIIAFSLAAQTGPAVIGDGTIAIEVANGTVLTNLVATFTLSDGANAKVGVVAQESGVTQNDFTSPVTYIVTAEDGETTKEWVVTVTVEEVVLPEVIFTETMGTVSSTTAISVHEAANGFDNDGFTMTDGGAAAAADIRATSTSSGYSGASGSANIFFTSTSGDRGFAIEGINVQYYANLTLQFGYRKESGTALPALALYYWDGVQYVNVPFTFNEITTAVAGWYLSPEISLPEAAQINGLKLKWLKTGTVSVRVDDVVLKGTAVPDTDAPVPTFFPLTGATDVPIAVNPTITFNEVIYTGAGVLVDNLNVEGLINFQDNLTNPVAFNATITDKVITIVPTANLANETQYTVTINPVQDENENLMGSSASTTFTTVAATAETIELTSTPTGPYYAGDNVLVTWTSANIDIVDVDVWVPSTSSWVNLANDVVAGLGQTTISIPTDAVYGTSYKIRVADAEDGTPSDESGTFTVIPVIEDLLTLRSKTADNTTLYKYTGVATITYSRPTAGGRYQKYIQDNTAAIVIDDVTNLIGGDYVVGDGITNVVGKLYNYSNLIQFVPVFATGEEVAGSAIVPEVRTIASLTSADQAKLVKVNDFQFATTGQYAISDLFVASKNYDVVGFANTAFVYRTAFSEADYIGQTIPTSSITIAGLVGQFNDVMQITARNLADFTLFSNDATLATFTLGGEDALGLNGVEVNDPLTDPGAILYVDNFTGFAGIVATTTDENATFEVKLNDVLVDPANYATQALADGDVVVVTITAEDGETVKYYKVTITAENRTLTLTAPVGGESYVTFDDIIFNWTSENIANLNFWAIDSESEEVHQINDAPIPATEPSFIFNIENGITGLYYLRVSDASDANFYSQLSTTISISDNVNPSIASTYPADMGVDVPIGFDLNFEFDEEMADGTGNIIIHLTSDDSPVVTLTSLDFTIDSRNASATISGLSYATSYYITADEGAFEDHSGNPSPAILKEGDRKLHFTTVAEPNPVLFFSEYLEGSSNNKALEIYNPTSEVVDLSAYTIKASNNGSGWGETGGVVDTRYILPLSGTILPGDVYVIANSAANQAIKDVADLLLTFNGTANGCEGCNVLAFNGDDAIGLFMGETLIDVIGTPEEDPGTAWTVAGVANATAEHTLVRKDAVEMGTTDWTASAGTNTDDSQWIVLGADVTTYLGWHKEVVDTDAPVVTFAPLNGATEVALDVIPTIAFDEPVRNIDDSEINNGNVASLITFTEGINPVAFTATINVDKTLITVTPTESLVKGKVYNLGLSPVEDASDNATVDKTASFTTIMPSSIATLSTFTLGGVDALNLYKVVVEDPETDEGASLYVADFTGFAGIVATSTSEVATRTVTLNGVAVDEGNLATQALVAGDVIVVTVTAEDETTIKYYKVTLTDVQIIDAELDTDLITFFTNWTNDPIAIEITWNDATIMERLTYLNNVTQEGGDLPGGSSEAVWEVINDNGTTATLMIYIDNSAKEGTFLTDQDVTLTAHFDEGNPSTIETDMMLKTFDLTFDIKDEQGNVIEGATVNVEPEFEGDGQVISQTGNIVEVAAKDSYKYTIEKDGYTTVSDVVAAVMEDKTIPVVMAVETAPEILAYWNFNANVPATSVNWTQPIASTLGTGEITYTLTQAYSFSGTTINGVVDEVEGGSFSPIGGTTLANNGKDFTIAFSTEGYKDVVITYPTRRTSTGFTSHEIKYTVNGTDWLTKETINISTFASSWLETQIITVDFTGVEGVDNNPDFAVRVIVTGASSDSGNNRIDNIKVAAVPGEFVDVTAPMATFNPADEAINVAISVSPTITFNEAIRNIDDSEITNDNVGALIAMAEGENPVAFSATINTEKTVITVNPDVTLTKATVYTITIQPVEDANNNATIEQGVSFTTVLPNAIATLDEFTLGGSDVMGLTGLEVVDPETEAGASLFVPDFTDFAGIVATATDANATVTVTLNGVLVAENDLATQVLANEDVVVVTVVAEDGETTKYFKVTLTNVASTLAEITEFSIAGQIGETTIVTETATIDLTVPFGTDVTALVAKFKLSDGATVKVGEVVQVSEVTANDFTEPVVYVVTAQDLSTTKNWTVTVTVEAGNEEAEITAFSFAEQTGAATITDGAINVEVGFGTDVTNLVATFELSEGATVKVGEVVQESGITANDFTGPVTYVVTAENGTTTKNWIVTVTVAEASVLFTENFDYTAATALTANGWTAHSGAGTSPIQVVTPGLEFDGYIASGIGNAASVTNNGEDVHKSFQPVTAGAAYAAFIVKTGSTNSAGYFMNLGQQTIGTTFFSRVYVNGSGNGLGISGSNAPATYVPITAGTPVLVVVKYDFTTKVSSLFVFNEFPDAEPATAHATFQETATILNVGSFALRQYNDAQDVIVDGIRVAPTWELAVMSGVDTQSPIATFNPADGATNVLVETIPTISFNEAIRNIDDSEITNANVASLITFSDGTNDVNFTATINDSKKLITITPAAALEYETEYTITLAAVEDDTDNATTVKSISFTTIASNTPIIELTSTPTGPYYAGDNVLVTWISANIDLVDVDVWVPSISDWYNLANDVVASLGETTITIPADALYSTGYILRVADAADGSPSDESGTFTVRAVSNQLSVIRQMPVNSEVKYTGTAIVTYTRTSRNQKYIQDTNGAILIDDNSGVITSPYVAGDAMTGLIGRVTSYFGLAQFVPLADPGAAVSTGNAIVPFVTDLASLTSADQSKLVRIPDVTFTSTGTFASGANYDIEDPSGSKATGIFRTSFSEADYIGQPIPTETLNALVALVGEYNGTLQLTSRNSGDIIEVQADDATLFTFTVGGINVMALEGLVVENPATDLGATLMVDDFTDFKGLSAVPNQNDATVSFTLNGNLVEEMDWPYQPIVEGDVIVATVVAADETTTMYYKVTTDQMVYTYNVTFNVVDVNEAPIADAVVTFNNVTNDPGNYEYTDVATGSYSYVVTKEGYITVNGVVNVTNTDVVVDVTLLEGAPMPIPFTETFDGDGAETPATWLPEGWSAVDADNDTYNWYWYSYEGNGVMLSKSWDSVEEALTPDNWLITPAIDLTTSEASVKLAFKVTPTGSSFNEEHYSVLISTTGTNPADFEEIHNETFTSSTTAWTFAEKVIDISNYMNQVVYIAFRHHNVTDMDKIALDDVMVYAGGIGVEVETLVDLKAFPNPFTNHINVVNAEGVSRVVVTNIIGQIVIDVKMNGAEGTINTSDLKRGIYLISFYGKNGERVVRKMIKE